jgi:hypothetical protein
MSCQRQLTLEQFAEYWYGELSEEQQARFEEHCFECELCGGRYEKWTEEFHAVEAYRRTAVRPVLTRAQFNELLNSSTRVQVDDLRTVVEWSTDSSVDVHAFRFPVEADKVRGLERLDVEYVDSNGHPYFHAADVPRKAEGGEIILACSRHIVASRPMNVTIRLIGRRGDSAEVVAERKIRFVGDRSSS